jgi:hypothetical protein
MKLPKLGDLLWIIPDKKTRDLVTAAGGMVLLLSGSKVVALGTFAKGLKGLEENWREVNDFDGSLADRWRRAIEFYEETHQDPVNRKLHIVGIPIIVGGAAGLLLFPSWRPLWMLSAGAFTFGWVLNLIGHGVFEKNAPAFADDPLAFVAGPVWDLTQLRTRGGKKASKRARRDEEGVIDVEGINVMPADPAVA